MARKPRGPVPAGVYHVWRRTAGPVPMFHDDLDRTAFCRRLTVAIRRYDWTCAAFVLMTTHFHLLLRVDDNVLSRGMHDLFGPYAQEFNRRHKRSGHLRAEPFKLRRLHSSGAIRVAARYIARNPPEAGLCELPQDWPWSSYAATAGYTQQFPFVADRLLVESLHDDVTRAQRLWREIVEAPYVKGVVPFTYVA